jgi:hypothetical protein
MPVGLDDGTGNVRGSKSRNVLAIGVQSTRVKHGNAMTIVGPANQYGHQRTPILRYGYL